MLFQGICFEHKAFINDKGEWVYFRNYDHYLEFVYSRNKLDDRCLFRMPCDKCVEEIKNESKKIENKFNQTLF